MATTKRRYSKDEFARRGDAIYEGQVLPQLKAADDGKFAAIDIETGEFAVDADELKACKKLRKRIPDAQIWMVRIGYRFVHRFGGRDERWGKAMISGIVQFAEGRIRFVVKGAQGAKEEVEAVVDTGYTASLTLPPSLIQALGLRWQTVDRVRLADGSVCNFDVYEGEVIWDGKVRQILVDEADADPLVGMRLLKGHELKMQVRYRGKITIKPLPRKSKHGK